MAWLAQFKGNLVAIDTAPLIYYIEENPAYLPSLEPFFQAVDSGDIRLITSTVTLLEVLVLPLKQQNTRLANAYRSILTNSRLQLYSVSTEIAEEAASLRASYGLRTPDAIGLAVAQIAKAPFFLTNDERLPSTSSVQTVTLKNLINQP